MALSFSLTLSNGVTVTYWKVANIYIDNINQRIIVNVAGYIDEPAYAAGSSYVTLINEVLTGTQYVDILASSNVISTFYTLLSQLPDFSGSVIVG